MFRRSSNEKVAFTETADAYNKQFQAALVNRRAEMGEAWDALDVEWEKLEKRMATIGITKPVSLDGGVVHLNVGGEHLNVRRTVLESIQEKNTKQRWTLANLFDGVWDSRVPRDKGGRIVLDESPVIMRHLVHTQLKASKPINQASGVSRDLTTPPPLPSDQRPYLQNVSRALGLHNVPIGMEIIGGTPVLKTDELAQLSVHIQNWCPGDPQKLELLYRGSRDGFFASAFHAKCTDKNPSTVTLVKVDHGGPDGSSCVVGGFSSVSWARKVGKKSHYTSQEGSYHYYYETISPDAFIFMLNDGSTQGQGGSEPEVWALPKGPESHAIVRCGDDLGPDFGKSGYRVSFDRDGGPASLNCLSTSIFQNLAGNRVSEVEVYSVGNEPSTENTRLFGASIAGALMEEGLALHDAQIELASADKRIRAVACALEAIYGPDIATGKPDPVVELLIDVRGTRITTLRSTLLQAFPESALAARFNDSKGPSDGKDFGVIDCSPSIFSKVLDVLRTKKRARWLKTGKYEDFSNAMIASGDRAPFEEFVGMYFPGCEAYVMDWVTFEGS
ncbi:unnamed protein product [Ascophyllum nodosum]